MAFCILPGTMLRRFRMENKCILENDTYDNYLRLIHQIHAENICFHDGTIRHVMTPWIYWWIIIICVAILYYTIPWKPAIRWGCALRRWFLVWKLPNQWLLKFDEQMNCVTNRNAGISTSRRLSTTVTTLQLIYILANYWPQFMSVGATTCALVHGHSCS